MTADEDHGDRPLSAKVEALAGYGLSGDDIALVLGQDADGLAAEYETELAAGSIKANARVAESLFRKATGDGQQSVTAAIFWLKTRARWKETSVHEVVADPKKIDLSTWTDEMLEAAIANLLPQVQPSNNDG